MNKIINKIKYWICKGYLEKHIKVLQIHKAISLIDMDQERDTGSLKYRMRCMAIDLAEELIKSGAIEIKEETDHRANLELIRMKLRYWV